MYVVLGGGVGVGCRCLVYWFLFGFVSQFLLFLGWSQREKVLFCFSVWVSSILLMFAFFCDLRTWLVSDFLELG